MNLRYFVVDNNFAQREGLRELLTASKSNRAVITEPLMVEWHKNNAAFTMRKRMALLCEFPDQLVVARRTRHLMRLNGETKGLLRRVIDHKQTANAASFCELNINAPLDDSLKSAFDTLQEQAADQVAALDIEGAKMFAAFGQLHSNLPKADKIELIRLEREKFALNPDLQSLTFQWTLAHAYLIHSGCKLPEPQSVGHFVNTICFRFAAMMLGLFLVRHSNVGSPPKKPDLLINHIMDLKIAATASYFDGFKTYETDLAKAYVFGMSMIRALGGYRDSGRSVMHIAYNRQVPGYRRMMKEREALEEQELLLDDD
jgi:hypothetical protein